MGGFSEIAFSKTRPGWELRSADSESGMVLAYLEGADSFPIGRHDWVVDNSPNDRLPLMLHKVSRNFFILFSQVI